MSAVADKRGLKRICTGCGARYYDFNKRPVVCPSCKTEFTTEVKTKRRGRSAAANDEVVAVKAVVPAPAQDEEEVVAVEGEDVVSLQEVEELEEDADDTEEETLDTEDDDAGGTPTLDADEDDDADLDDEDDEDDLDDEEDDEE